MRPETPILVVDDSPAIRRLMQVYLGRLGFRHVRTAETVEEALRVFREQEPEIVFVDMVLDEKEAGADFIAQALEERPLAEIVVMTALPPSHELVRASISEGARDFLQKPIRMTAVREAIDRLDRERSEHATESEDATYA